MVIFLIVLTSSVRECELVIRGPVNVDGRIHRATDQDGQFLDRSEFFEENPGSFDGTNDKKRLGRLSRVHWTLAPCFLLFYSPHDAHLYADVCLSNGVNSTGEETDKVPAVSWGAVGSK